MSLRQFYSDWLEDENERRVAAGKLASNTLSKNRQALNRWERFTRPGDWAAERPWPGLPIGSITSRYVTWFLERLTQATCAATAKSTWSHLRTVFKAAVRLRAIVDAPVPEQETVDAKATIYKPSQIEAAYRALAPHPDLQVAFVLSLNAGLRPVDLFALSWNNVELDTERPLLDFTSQKTSKQQGVPLAPVTVAHLMRLPSSRRRIGKLFPGRQGEHAKDRERSRPARTRSALVKKLLAAVRIRYSKPFQAGRATCNERLEAHRQGSGQFVLGHALTLNSRSYRQPDQMIFEAITTVPQPECFHEF